MKSQYLSTLMSVTDFSQWDFFHIKTRSSDGKKPEKLQLVTQSTGKIKERERERARIFFLLYFFCVQMIVDKPIVPLCFVQICCDFPCDESNVMHILFCNL